MTQTKNLSWPAMGPHILYIQMDGNCIVGGKPKHQYYSQTQLFQFLPNPMFEKAF